MTSAPTPPAALRLVLRDRTHAEGEQVLLLALGDLVDLGLWTVQSGRRGLRRRTLLARTAAPVPEALPESLAFVHGLLEKAVARDAEADVEAVARWFGRHARRAGPTAAKLAIDDLIRSGHLERHAGTGFRGLRATPAGEAVLAEVPPREEVVGQLGRAPGRRAARRELLPGGFGWAAGVAGAAALAGAVSDAWASGHATGVAGLGGPHGSSSLDGGDGWHDGGGSHGHADGGGHHGGH